MITRILDRGLEDSDSNQQVNGFPAF